MKLTSQQLKDFGYVQLATGDYARVGPSKWGALSAELSLPSTILKGSPKPPRRIRQDQKPLMNKLEQEWLNSEGRTFHEDILPQAIGFRLGNGVVYWPDFVALSFTHAWEIKGRQPIQDDSVVKIKVAARLYPQIKWRLAWKLNGAWQYQIVLP